MATRRSALAALALAGCWIGGVSAPAEAHFCSDVTGVMIDPTGRSCSRAFAFDHARPSVHDPGAFVRHRFGGSSSVVIVSGAQPARASILAPRVGPVVVAPGVFTTGSNAGFTTPGFSSSRPAAAPVIVVIRSRGHR
jgi:hypothetical protein